jgi:hypothetical protein
MKMRKALLAGIVGLCSATSAIAQALDMRGCEGCDPAIVQRYNRAVENQIRQNQRYNEDRLRQIADTQRRKTLKQRYLENRTDWNMLDDQYYDCQQIGYGGSPIRKVIISFKNDSVIF